MFLPRRLVLLWVDFFFSLIYGIALRRSLVFCLVEYRVAPTRPWTRLTPKNIAPPTGSRAEATALLRLHGAAEATRKPTRGADRQTRERSARVSVVSAFYSHSRGSCVWRRPSQVGRERGRFACLLVPLHSAEKNVFGGSNVRMAHCLWRWPGGGEVVWAVERTRR